MAVHPSRKGAGLGTTHRSIEIAMALYWFENFSTPVIPTIDRTDKPDFEKPIPLPGGAKTEKEKNWLYFRLY